jgi:hypothetical protein
MPVAVCRVFGQIPAFSGLTPDFNGGLTELFKGVKA